MQPFTLFILEILCYRRSPVVSSSFPHTTQHISCQNKSLQNCTSCQVSSLFRLEASALKGIALAPSTGTVSTGSYLLCSCRQSKIFTNNVTFSQQTEGLASFLQCSLHNCCTTCLGFYALMPKLKLVLPLVTRNKLLYARVQVRCSDAATKLADENSDTNITPRSYRQLPDFHVSGQFTDHSWADRGTARLRRGSSRNSSVRLFLLILTTALLETGNTLPLTLHRA